MEYYATKKLFDDSSKQPRQNTDPYRQLIANSMIFANKNIINGPDLITLKRSNIEIPG
jgi:hypothetical protein